MTHEEYLDHTNKLFELIVEAKAMAVAESGRHFWFRNTPCLNQNEWYGEGCYYLGTINYQGDWKYSLVVRKWVPKHGLEYFFSAVSDMRLYCKGVWDGYDADEHRLKHNLVFKTKEEAIARSKELLGIKE